MPVEIEEIDKLRVTINRNTSEVDTKRREVCIGLSPGAGGVSVSGEFGPRSRASSCADVGSGGAMGGQMPTKMRRIAPRSAYPVCTPFRLPGAPPLVHTLLPILRLSTHTSSPRGPTRMPTFA